jgi:hypothetical protein
MTPVSVPPRLGTTHVIGPDGTTYRSRHDGQRLVIDLPPDVFRILVAGDQGLLWSNENHGNDVLWQRLSQGSYSN